MACRVGLHVYCSSAQIIGQACQEGRELHNELSAHLRCKNSETPKNDRGAAVSSGTVDLPCA